MGPFTKEDVIKAIGEGKVVSTRRMCHKSNSKWADASAFSVFNEAFKPNKVWFAGNASGDPEGPYTQAHTLKFVNEGKVKPDRKLCNVRVDKSKWGAANTWSTNGKKTFFR